MATTRGDVETSFRILNCNEEIHTIIWTIPEFMNITCSAGGIEAPNTGPKTYFQLKVTGGGNVYYLNYKSQKPVFLKSVEVKGFTFKLDNWTFSETEETIMSSERQIVLNNNWNSIGHLWNNGQYKDLGFSLQNPNAICLLSDNSLRLKYVFVVPIKKYEARIVIPASELDNDYKNLFKQGKHFDIVMRSSDNKQFRVHKGVLACRSAVLNAHFEHNFTESTTNIVETHLEWLVLREVLLFIYTDKAEVDKMPEKMLAAADYYQLNRLKKLCEESLLKKLTKENATETLQLAEAHNSHALKQLTLEFIKRYGVENNNMLN